MVPLHALAFHLDAPTLTLFWRRHKESETTREGTELVETVADRRVVVAERWLVEDAESARTLVERRGSTSSAARTLACYYWIRKQRHNDVNYLLDSKMLTVSSFC